MQDLSSKTRKSDEINRKFPVPPDSQLTTTAPSLSTGLYPK